MDDTLRLMPTAPARRALLWLATVLACIRVLAVVICSSCFVEFESPAVRAFYLHDGSDHNACHHGQAPVGPLTAWACEVTQDDAEFVLPDSPRLPLIVSFFVPLTFLVMSCRERLLLAGKGRSPPRCSALS